MKRHLLFSIGIVLISILIVNLLSAKAMAFTAGSGTSGDPYQITTPAELASMTSYLGSGNSDKYFKLMNDIDLNVSPYNTGSGWTPIGNSSSNFYGKFDGDGHSITGLYIDRTTSYSGLFGYTQGATIQNVSLTGANVTSTATYTGILVGRAYNNNTISSVSTNGTVSSSSNYVGGLIGSMHSGSITNANSFAAVTGAQYVGGLLGEINGTTSTNPDISDSYATGDIRADSYIGGFVGYKVYGAVSRSYASGDILGDRTGGLTNDYGGGFAGAVCYGSIVRSYATGHVYGDNELAGFVGLSHNCSGTTITDNYARGDVYPSVSGTGGGFMRYNYLATVQRNYSTGLVDGQTNGGFIYWDVGCGGCSNNYWDSQTSLQTTGGLFVGAGATSKTTAQMKSVATFTTTNAWDFVGNPGSDVANNDYWDIVGTINDGYPYLSWQKVNASPDAPSSLGPSSKVNGSYGTDNTPSLSFVLSDADIADTTKYRIQIDDSSDFGSPVVDYTSALAAQGATSFSAGQDVGSGSYISGSAGQSLGDGSYYWRVKTIDDSGSESSYTTANSSNIAFIIDTTSPSIPGTPSTTSNTEDQTPTWNWTASSDSGSGLAAAPYTLEWSQSSDFTDSSSASTVSNSYTVDTELAEGTWYFRVKAIDDLGNESSYSATRSFTIELPRDTNSNATSNTISSITSLVGFSIGTIPRFSTSEFPLPNPDPEVITLNTFEEFFDQGKQLELSQGQVLYFCPKASRECEQDELHTATVENIDQVARTVTLVLRSEPISVTLAIGETKAVDVDNDSRPDVAITLNDIQSDNTRISFKSLAAANTGGSEQIAQQPLESSKNNQNFLQYTLFVLSMIAVLSVVVVVIRRRSIHS